MSGLPVELFHFIDGQDDSNLFVDFDDSVPNIVVEYLFQDVPEDDAPPNFLEVNPNTIRLSEKDLYSLINLFEANQENFYRAVCNLFRGPYKGDFILDFVLKWYMQGIKNTEETIQEFFYAEFAPENSNAWFFAIVNELNEPQRNLILEKYFNNFIDTTAGIDISEPITYSMMKLQLNYQKRDGVGIRVGDFMTDLKKIVVYIDNSSVYIMKVKSPTLRKAELKFLNHYTFKLKMKELNLGYYFKGKKKKAITGFDVLEFANNKNYITCEDMVFFDQNPATFNLFQGFEYDSVDEINYSIIQPFMNHIHRIICNSNNDLYKYLIYWLSFIFQNPKGKTQIAIVLTGAQGTGKSTFTNVICKLLGNYANENAKLEDITGKFNNPLLYKKLLICNEVESFISNKSYDSERMKTLITEDNIDINLKFRDTIHQENVANFIFISNNFAPIKIEEGDRRYVVIEVSSEKRSNFEYFRELNETFTEEFYRHLLTFFLEVNLENWDRLRIPMTRAKQAIIEFCKSPYSTFIQNYINRFVEGCNKQESYNEYKEWCSRNGYKSGTVQNYRMGILKFCEEVSAIGSETKNLYRLKRESYQYFNIQREEEENNNNHT